MQACSLAVDMLACSLAVDKQACMLSCMEPVQVVDMLERKLEPQRRLVPVGTRAQVVGTRAQVVHNKPVPVVGKRVWGSKSPSVVGMSVLEADKLERKSVPERGKLVHRKALVHSPKHIRGVVHRTT